jgi:hypothetical protein
MLHAPAITAADAYVMMALCLEQLMALMLRLDGVHSSMMLWAVE